MFFYKDILNFLMEPFSDADIKRKKRKEFPWEEKDIPLIRIRDFSSTY
ncbi:unnamed protein product, partial [marine sediment metagenome]